MRGLVVPQLNRADTSRHSLEFLGNAGRLADGIEQHLGLDRP